MGRCRGRAARGARERRRTLACTTSRGNRLGAALRLASARQGHDGCLSRGARRAGFGKRPPRRADVIDETTADPAPRKVLSSGPGRHGDGPADPLSRRAAGRPDERPRDEPLTQDESRRRGRRAGHARREPVDGRRRGRGSDVAALARARRGRPSRAARAQPDGAAGVLRRATEGAADHLVPQRGRAARLALPALLSSFPRVRPSPRCRASWSRPHR